MAREVGRISRIVPVMYSFILILILNYRYRSSQIYSTVWLSTVPAFLGLTEL
jgi:hypothetical protein